MRLSLLLTAAILLFTLPSLDAIPASQGINVVDTVPKVVLDSQLAQRLISQEAFDEATGGVNKGARKIPRAAVNAAMAKFPVGGAPAKPPQLVQAPPKSSVEPPSAQVIAPPPKLSGGQQQKVTVGGPSAPSQQSKVSKFASKPGAPATATDHPIFQRLRKQLVDEQGGKGVGVVPPPPSSGKVVGVVPPPPSSGKVVGVVPPPPSSGKGVELVTGSKAGGGIVQSQHAPPPAPPQDAHLGTLPANGGYAFEQQDGTITKIHSYVNGKYDGGVLDVEFSALNRGAKNAVNVITLTSGGKFYARAYIPIHSAVAYIFTTDEKVTTETIPTLYNVAISIPAKVASVVKPNKELSNDATWKVKGGAPFATVKGDKVYQPSQAKAFGGFGIGENEEWHFSTSKATTKAETLAAAFYPIFAQIHS